MDKIGRLFCVKTVFCAALLASMCGCVHNYQGGHIALKTGVPFLPYFEVGFENEQTFSEEMKHETNVAGGVSPDHRGVL